LGILGHRISDHGSAVAPAADRDSCGIGDALADQVLRTCGYVVHFATGAVFDVQVPKLFAVPGAPSIVWLQYRIALLRQIECPRVPAESVLALGPAVNPQHSWIANPCLVTNRLVEHRSYLELVLALVVHPFGRAESGSREVQRQSSRQVLRF